MDTILFIAGATLAAHDGYRLYLMEKGEPLPEFYQKTMPFHQYAIGFVAGLAIGVLGTLLG
jgi:hypothetical protein